MDYYILDINFKRVSVIEGFSSMLWTERYNAYGDFELHIPTTAASKAQYKSGVRVGRQGSQYVMVVDTITDAVDDDGNQMLTVTGKSLENIFNGRVAMPTMDNLVTNPTWVLVGTPGDVMRTIFSTVCVDGALSENDIIPNYHSGTLNTAGSLGEPLTETTITLKPQSMYAAFQTIATTYALGFRLIKDGDTGDLYFEIFTGDDRTSAQDERDAVIFSEALDNLTGRTTLTSTASNKTAAYVYAQNGTMVVYNLLDQETATGFDRTILFVDASDIDTSAGPTLNAALTQKGLEALADLQGVYQFDGQIPEGIGYIYGVDYNLGDIVEEQDETGFGNRMRVTEQIFVSDNEGERAYPTLSLETVVVPGTWAAWDAAQHWAEVPDDEHWADI